MKMRTISASAAGPPRGLAVALGAALAISLAMPIAASGQRLPGTENGEWRYFAGDAGATRSSPLDQINASNFEDLEVAWIWRGDNFSRTRDYFFRSTPIFVDGRLFTVAGVRRQVAAIDPATGETLWTFREPETIRHMRSPRQAYGKGVAYGEVDGRGVIYITTPGFFLWALDAESGRPLENWGRPVPLRGFSRTGVVDLLPDLVRDWGPWEDHVAAGGAYDPDYGIPRELGMITSSAPPIVVNDVVVVLNSHQPGYGQSRIENIPGDIMGFDARTGEFLWKFHVIPRPGEVGHETWENDAWYWSGNVGQWAGASADPERGIVYIVTNNSTIQSYSGHRPGDNLFGGSILALDARTGERKWHFQVHRSDRWNYDLPVPPMLMDLTVEGRTIPALIQNTKQGFIFAFDRVTGEPIWPIEERPVIQTEVPGDYTARTQPYPTRPEPLDRIILNGLTEEFVIDYTPEVEREALEILSRFRVGGLYVPPLPYNHTHTDFINQVGCQGAGNVVSHPPAADPSTGRLYASHRRTCNAAGYLAPTNGIDVDDPSYAHPDQLGGATPNETPTTGRTVVAWRPVAGAPQLPRIQGLPLWKPINQHLSAFDLNTGDKLWNVPVGRTPDALLNHPLLQGRDPESGANSFSIQMVAGDLLLQAQAYSEGVQQIRHEEAPRLHARDKWTGEILGSVELPAPAQYGMMTYLHEGRQYIVVQIGSIHADFPGSLVALRLP
jgi:glucose dehydrogenase